jgi:hypothetical protein
MNRAAGRLHCEHGPPWSNRGGSPRTDKCIAIMPTRKVNAMNGYETEIRNRGDYLRDRLSNRGDDWANGINRAWLRELYEQELSELERHIDQLPDAGQ